ncbi:hypothetical protein [Pseudomonas zhanjiangensis]|uniref:Uncharacterized protein n=1 Tax=Pseudomonas zhanjiangensis TaxID=3239015 RepID=A0ABV3YUL3_9PSED
MVDTPAYLSLKLAQASKTGKHAAGRITYRILTDPKRDQLYLTLVSNEGGGWFSTEIVPFARVEAVAEAINDPSAPLLSKQLRQAFISRSANNAGFLAAVLRAEGLLAPSPEAAHQHVMSGDWSQWKQAMLSAAGEAYVPFAKAGAPEAEPSKQGKPTSKRKGRTPAPDVGDSAVADDERTDAVEADDESVA